ncbi:Fumagillin beta-trans-bergamotene synthase [Colletotrichum sidae]|uniref:Fumagillin beta-trans-bergamotene synthase n=1 Tax=Colletotrichum sidae TaxID=1347389 RepID=A0A4R8TKP7_9PEZI|nr:Fumagillin beta-trans-bergamotene synthase [Colletotrichum sidae]
MGVIKVGDYQDGCWRRSLLYNLETIYLFLKADIKNVVLPHTLFALSSLYTGRFSNSGSTPLVFTTFLPKLCHAALWLAATILVERVTNQRLPASIIEDAFNKPWRPLASGRITPEETQSLALWLVPAVMLFGAASGAFRETASLMVITWMYNDLDAANASLWWRTAMNALALMNFSAGAMVVATGPLDYSSSGKSVVWILLTGLIVLTTIHCQDLPDIVGDKARGRETIPLVWGETVARTSLALWVLFWSIAIPLYWEVSSVAFGVTFGVGLGMAFWTLYRQRLDDDRFVWKLWQSQITEKNQRLLQASHMFGELEMKGKVVVILGIADMLATITRFFAQRQMSLGLWNIETRADTLLLPERYFPMALNVVLTHARHENPLKKKSLNDCEKAAVPTAPPGQRLRLFRQLGKWPSGTDGAENNAESKRKLFLETACKFRAWSSAVILSIYDPQAQRWKPVSLGHRRPDLSQLHSLLATPTPEFLFLAMIVYGTTVSTIFRIHPNDALQISVLVIGMTGVLVGAAVAGTDVPTIILRLLPSTILLALSVSALCHHFLFPKHPSAHWNSIFIRSGSNSRLSVTYMRLPRWRS